MSYVARDGLGNQQNFDSQGDGTQSHPLVPTHTRTAAKTVVINLTSGTSLVAASQGLKLIGYSVLEIAGSAASFNLYHGSAPTGGQMIEVPIVLAANERHAQTWPGGVDCHDGIVAQWVSGQMTLILYYEVGYP
jgi:hypothetical protein